MRIANGNDYGGEPQPRGHRPLMPGMGLTSHTIGVALPPEWTRDALCAEVDPELFFPMVGQNTAHIAKRVCGHCTVRRECLEYAMQHHENWGVWGGLSERERRRLRNGSAA